MRTPRPRPTRYGHRPARGSTLITVLVGTLVGMLVIGSATVFVLNASSSKSASLDRTQKQTLGLSALNRIARDVSDATAVAYADTDHLVLDHDTTGTRTRVAWGIDRTGDVCQDVDATDGCLFRTTLDATSSPEAQIADLATSAGEVQEFGPVRTSTLEPLFTFASTDPTVSDDDTDLIPAALLPATNPGAAETIKRVDIAFAANTENGYVALRTAAALNTGDANSDGTGTTAAAPACPVPAFTATDPATLAWSAVGGATSFTVSRDDQQVATVAVTDADDAAYTWVDDPASDPAAPTSTDPAAVPVRYTVTADGPGGASTLDSAGTPCPALTWYPQLPAPTLTAALSPDTAAGGPDWYSTETGQLLPGPTVTLTWPAVVGATGMPADRATGYDIYTAQLPTNATTTAGATWQKLTTTTATSHTVDVAFDDTWAFYVTAAGTMPGSSGRSAIAVVEAHPQGPATATVTDDGAGAHVVSWDAYGVGASADGYAVYRREAPDGTWLLLGPTTDLTYTDTTPEADVTYEYGVAATNTGPRGLTDTGGGTSGIQHSPLAVTTPITLPAPTGGPVSGVDPAPATAPVAKAYGSDRDGDTARVPEHRGSNLIAWNDVAGATGYRVYAYDTYTSGVVSTSSRTLLGTVTSPGTGCLTGYTLCFDDTGRAPGTERYYAVTAFTAGGEGPRSGLVAAYQAPTAATTTSTTATTTANRLWISDAPTLSTSNVTFGWNQTIDGGMDTTAKFCTKSRGGCGYTLTGVDPDAPATVLVPATTFAGTLAGGTVRQPAGASVTYQLQVCNTGGCVTLANGGPRAETYPDPIAIETVDWVHELHGNEWWSNKVQETHSNYASAFINWSSAGPDVVYHASRVPLAADADPFDRRLPAGYTSGTKSGAVYTGTSRTWPGTASNARLTPGHRYEFKVFATSPNGKVRETSAVLLPPPARMPVMDAGTFCRPNNPALVKPAVDFVSGGWSSGQYTKVHWIQYAWWAGSLTVSEYNTATSTGVNNYILTKKLNPRVNAVDSGSLTATQNPTNWSPGSWETTKYEFWNVQRHDGAGYPGDNKVKRFLLNPDWGMASLPHSSDRGYFVIQFYMAMNWRKGDYDFGAWRRTGGVKHEETWQTLTSCPSAPIADATWRWDGRSARVGRWVTTGFDAGLGNPNVAPSTAGYGSRF